MKRQVKHTFEEQTQLSEVASASGKTPPREFASAEEMLRFDAAQTSVPPGIAQRLRESTTELPRPKPSWWKRFIGGTNL